MKIHIEGRARYTFLLTMEHAELLKMACELNYDGFVKTHGKKIVEGWIRVATNFKRDDGMVEIQVDDRSLQTLAKALEMAWGPREQQNAIRAMHHSLMTATRTYNRDFYHAWQTDVES